jgi:hypothetical protein
MNKKHKRKALKVYHQYRYRPIMFFVRCFFGWMVLYTILSMLTSSTLAPIGQALIITIALNFVAPSYLATHEDALEYRTIFKHLVVPWEDLSRLAVVEEYGAGEGVYSRFLYLKDQNNEPLRIGPIVPILYKRSKTGYYIDIDHLLNTPFGQDLQKYAPHVIEAAREAENRAKAS